MYCKKHFKVGSPHMYVVSLFQTSKHSSFISGIDCDQVFSNIILGNGATVKKKDYLKRIGITHILNSAEYRGVNVGNDYFNKMGDNFQYFGIRIEDTPQTQICK